MHHLESLIKTSQRAFNLSNGIDLCMLPPCRSSLQMHCMRSNYVAFTWKTAYVPFQNLQSPAGIGWIVKASGELEVQWTSGRILPQQLADVLYGTEVEVSSEETDEFEMNNIIDVFFKCMCDLLRLVAYIMDSCNSQFNCMILTLS